MKKSLFILSLGFLLVSPVLRDSSVFAQTNTNPNSGGTTQTPPINGNPTTGGTNTNPNSTGGGVNTNPNADGPSSTTSDFPLKIKLENPLKVDTVNDAIALFMDVVIKIAIPFIVVFFIWSGISFILARGNPTKIETAKKMFLYTVIGTLLILGAWAITNAIVGTINTIAS